MVNQLMDNCLEFLKSRRSIRRFRRDSPPLDLILKAIDIARYAPSARNSQPWRFIVVNDPSLKNKLAEIHPWARPLKEAPIGVVVACHIDESPTSYMLDCANATIYLLLALHALGLGAVWIQALRNVEELRELLGIPNNAIPVAVIAIGYPDEKPEPRPRRPIDEVVFLNKYGSKFIVMKTS
jgi:nitroreductase